MKRWLVWLMAEDAIGPPANGAALLVSLRQQASFTQGELAQRAGVSRSMVAQVEAGERRPSRKLLARLSEAMQLAAEAEDQLRVAFGFTPAGDTPEQIAAFLRADKHLDSDQAERIADLVRLAYEQALRGRMGGGPNEQSNTGRVDGQVQSRLRHDRE